MADRKARFEAIYTANYEPILGYVMRRCPSPDDAADVVAETFTVAWRRMEEIPDGDRARLWMYGVARRVLANHRRAEEKRRQRTTSLRQDLRDEIAAVGENPVEAAAIAEAFRTLSDNDRELLGLLAWEGLDNASIAAVLGCGVGTVRVRVHRARKRFSRALRAAGVAMAAPAVVERPLTERRSLT